MVLKIKTLSNTHTLLSSKNVKVYLLEMPEWYLKKCTILDEYFKMIIGC